MLKLTEATVAGLPVDGRDRVEFEPGGGGFGIRVTKAGSKIFVAHARHAGAMHRVSIGTFPDMPVREARELAREALAAIRRGEDPKAARRAAAKATAAAAVTVAAFCDRWLDGHVRSHLKPRTIADYERLVADKIKPALGHLLVAAVTKADVLAFHESMKATPRRANYTVATVRGIMSYAEDVGIRPPMTNPARRIKMYREGRRERFLSEEEIGRAAEAITAAEQSGKIGPHAAAGLRLCLLTGARSGEIAAAQWRHVDWERRVIRLPNSKTNVPRTIHLSDAAVEVFKALPRTSPYIVAGAKPGEGYKNLSRAWIIAREFGELADCQLHDLRHSYASLAAGRGVSLQVIGALLGHRVIATTMRYSHLVRDAVAGVNDELGAVMAAAIEKGGKPPPGDNVVKLKAPSRVPAAKAKRRKAAR